MSLREWADLHGEEYPAKVEHQKPQRQTTIKDLQFCFDELLGELGWSDEVEETGVDPLAWARNEIKDLQKTVKRLRGSLELRNAAEHSAHWTGLRRCPFCEALLEENSVYCDTCGGDTPRQ